MLKKLKMFLEARDGQVQGIMGQFASLVAIAVLLAIGAFTVSKVQGSLSLSGINTEAQTAINNTFTNTYSAFDLGSITPIVVVASIIIAVVFTAFIVQRR